MTSYSVPLSWLEKHTWKTQLITNYRPAGTIRRLGAPATRQRLRTSLDYYTHSSMPCELLRKSIDYFEAKRPSPLFPTLSQRQKASSKGVVGWDVFVLLSH